MRLHGFVFKPKDKCTFICICYYTGPQPTAFLALKTVLNFFLTNHRPSQKAYYYYYYYFTYFIGSGGV